MKLIAHHEVSRGITPSVAALLDRALRAGHGVYVSYVGLEGPELHIARVRSRVALGGHDIPEHRIRQRYDSSRLNLIRLLPSLTELRVYDNSKNADPTSGVAPTPASSCTLRVAA